MGKWTILAPIKLIKVRSTRDHEKMGERSFLFLKQVCAVKTPKLGYLGLWREVLQPDHGGL